MTPLTRFDFGRAFSERLDNGYDPLSLARWAYRVHLDAAGIEDGLETELLKIIAMEQGPEFELPVSELRALATALQVLQ